VDFVTGLDAQRSAIRSLLAPSAPEDAPTAYYALYHDPRRTQLTLHRAPNGEVEGFVAVCQTGHDLFRPLVVVRALREGVLGALFRQALDANRPYYLIAPLDLSAALEKFLEMAQPTVNRIYRVDPERFDVTRSVPINVLVQERRGPDGHPRWEIRSGGRIAAVAGTNWRSPFCAEIYVQTEADFQGRGWGRAVVRAATLGLLREGLVPLYMVGETNLRSIRLAEAVGYSDTGRRELAAGVRLSSGQFYGSPKVLDRGE
jgi:GNAT superfamily N-acetyltransferase